MFSFETVADAMRHKRKMKDVRSFRKKKARQLKRRKNQPALSTTEEEPTYGEFGYVYV